MLNDIEDLFSTQLALLVHHVKVEDPAAEGAPETWQEAGECVEKAFEVPCPTVIHPEQNK